MKASPPFEPEPLRRAFRQVLPLLDLLPEVFIFAKDREHRFVLANQAQWMMHGCDSEAGMLGRNDHDFHPPVLAAQYRQEDRQVMDSGKPLLNQVWLVPHANGSPFWYVSSKLPLRNEQGDIIGIGGIMRPYERAGAPPGEYRRLMPAVDYARSHYSEPLAISQLAAKAGLSASQFQREFRRVFGVTPGNYLQQVRLQAARHLLEQTEEPLSGIALECGFHDQSHFSKRFKTATGLGPRAYRERFSPHRDPQRPLQTWPPSRTDSAPAP